MYNGDVGGVSGGGNVQWNKKLAEELDAADGKKDGKISANIWNGFLNKTGSSGNKIKNFINLNNAEKSFNYYEKKKDAGNVDWSNWETLLNDFKKEQGLPVDDPKVDPKPKPNPDPKVDPKTDKPTVEEIQTAMKDSPMANIKTPQDIKQMDRSRFRLSADCGANETRMLNPDTGESLVGKEDVTAGKGTITYDNGTVKHTVNYELGDSGKLLSGEVSVKQPDGSVKTYKYTYDENGNVVPEEPKPNPDTERQEAFNKLEESGVLDNKPHTAETLKAAGYGVKHGPYDQQDEDGMYYAQDMNGGRTYYNDKGESIRISGFEAGHVKGGKVEVTYTSADGKTKNHIVYGENDKPIEGFVEVKDGEIMSYTFDADGNKVLKEAKKELTAEQKAEFAKNSPINAIQSGEDFEKLDFSAYEKNLLNYQGSEVFKNKQTGEQIFVEREYGVGGYKTLSITYTKDGITQEIKFDKETGKIASNEIRAAKPEDEVNVPVIDIDKIHHGGESS